MRHTTVDSRPFDVVCLGYNSVDLICCIERFVEHGKKTQMTALHKQGGGQAATAAVAVQRLGFRARYLGKFGGDELGCFSRQTLIDLGIETQGCVHAAPHVANQLAIVLVDELSGERTIAYHRSRELELLPGELQREHVTSGRMLLCDSHQIPALFESVGWAREAGMCVVLDAERTPPGIERLLELVDYIVSDSSFVCTITGIDDKRRALAQLARMHGKGNPVVMTDGRNGSLAWHEGRIVEAAGFDVKVCDTTGAGDVFHAAFVCGLLHGYDLPRLLTFCNAAAALKSTRLGGRDGIPDRETLLRFIADNGR
ncbi:MAG: carbohydrate kinase family protein [Candidatus Alcyoniella australis]|nr:carbohydrate kinase family protein [Candidatus Alcyoniella australis]